VPAGQSLERHASLPPQWGKVWMGRRISRRCSDGPQADTYTAQGLSERPPGRALEAGVQRRHRFSLRPCLVCPETRPAGLAPPAAAGGPLRRRSRDRGVRQSAARQPSDPPPSGRTNRSGRVRRLQPARGGRAGLRRRAPVPARRRSAGAGRRGLGPGDRYGRDRRHPGRPQEHAAGRRRGRGVPHLARGHAGKDRAHLLEKHVAPAPRHDRDDAHPQAAGRQARKRHRSLAQRRERTSVPEAHRGPGPAERPYGDPGIRGQASPRRRALRPPLDRRRAPAPPAAGRLLPGAFRAPDPGPPPQG
jgi:hypothetical protein